MFDLIMPILEQQVVHEPIINIEQINSGCYYLTPRQESGYTVNKVLKTDNHGVHVRLYSNVFTEIPEKLNTKDLFIANMDEVSDEIAMGIGHIPVSYDSFLAWQAIDLHICQSVDDSELEGYRTWKEAGGGYF